MTPPGCVTLTHSSGTRAQVLTGFGFNAFDWTVPHRGHEVQVLWQHRQFSQGTERPSGSGIPLLFPFPGRISQASFTWEGRTFQLPARDGRGNAIHGFVHDRPWRVLEQVNSLDQSPSVLVGEFQASIDGPEIAPLWPADFRIQARYELTECSLSLTVEFSNPDTRPLPCGFGAHPYFRLPLGGDQADACRISLPVRSRWELVELLPTGRRLPVENATSLQSGVPFGDLSFDDAFTDLAFTNGWTTAAIDDPASGLRLLAKYDSAFRECVVYTPPHREAICIEPLTCVPGAMKLLDPSLDTGLRVLAPGESLTARMRFEVLRTSD